MKLFLSYLVLFGIKNNIMISNATGAIEFQREKKYQSFKYISAGFLMLGILLCSFVAYMLHNFVYGKFDLYYVGTSVIVLFVGLYNMIVATIFSKISSFQHYLYDTSFAYVMDFAYTLSVVFALDMTLPIGEFAVAVAAVISVVLIMNIIIGFFVESLNKSYLNINYRNVPARLCLMAVFSIILFYLAQLVW